MSQTLASILEAQSSLLEAASEALPHQFSQCTYPLGPIRQAVYLCLTCKEPRGICSACSIACHTDHEQLELFPKRNFRCDCPTKALSHACTLHPALEDENANNIYGQNFQGVFCRCGRQYDAHRERETMIQCLACEDWFHESCLNLRERPPSRESTPERAEAAGQGEADDAASEESTGLPSPLINASDYDCLVCSTCVRGMPVLRQYAGTPGVLMVVRDSPGHQWKVIGSGNEDIAQAEVQKAEPESESDAGEKRARSPNFSDTPPPKRARVSPEPTASSPCLAPPVNPIAQKVLNSDLGDLDALDSEVCPHFLGQGDIFLMEGWRDRWCKCNSCLPSLKAYPYLLEEEETYEPPEDPDSGLSLEELGLRALQRLPRDRAIEGIRAFNAMRDELINHLRPFAQEGKEVTEADIRAFFDEHMQAAK